MAFNSPRSSIFCITRMRNLSTNVYECLFLKIVKTRGTKRNKITRVLLSKIEQAITEFTKHFRTKQNSFGKARPGRIAHLSICIDDAWCPKGYDYYRPLAAISQQRFPPARIGRPRTTTNKGTVQPNFSKPVKKNTIFFRI